MFAPPPLDSHRRGQALVEMAIMLPVLLLIVFMALDLGRVFFGWVGLTNASRIGASYAAAHPTAWGTPGNATQRAQYESQILADANALNCELPEMIPAPLFPNGTDLRDQAQVTLTCEFSLITPLVSQIVGGTITIRAESIFPIRSGFVGGVPVSSTLPSLSGSPSFTPDPSATPAPTPEQCKVPSFIDDRVGTSGNPNPALQAKWGQAGFTTTLVITRPPNNNYRVGSQSPLVAGQWGPCHSTVESVGH